MARCAADLAGCGNSATARRPGRSGRDVGWLDIAALIRQVLLEQDARHGVELSLIRTAQAPPFPTREQWEQAGCEALSYGDEQRQALPWLAASRGTPTAEDAGEPGQRFRRRNRPPRTSGGCTAGEQKESPACPADPFWTTALGEELPAYKSVGQRQAARTVVTAPPGSTSIVCLPTGQGKTEVAMAPALFASRVQRRLRARRADRRARVRPRTADPGALLAEAGRAAEPQRPIRLHRRHERRAMKQQIRDAIRDGTQRIVVTAPRRWNWASAAASPPRRARVICSTSSSTRLTSSTSGAVASARSSRPWPASG